MNEQAEAAARAMSAPGVSLLEAIGNTPLLDLSRIAAGVPGLRLLAKAEHMNPGGSVKDRPARAMLLDGLRRGLLAPGKTILEATSGNTGIADAMIGRALGFPVTLCVPAKGSSAQKAAILEAFGAEIVPTDPLEGSDGAIRKARAMAAAEPERYFYPDQYSNPENWRAHFTTTGPEIWEETRGELTHFVAGLGTTGTFGGGQRRRGGPRGPRDDRPAGDDSHHPLRRRREISLAALLGRAVIALDPKALETIREHGRQAYPEECCGALLGTAYNGSARVSRVARME